MKGKNKSFSIFARMLSFKFAFEGLWDMLRTEPNAWLHAIATAAVLSLCLWLGLDAFHLAIIVLIIVCVWTAEAFNTVLEILVDNLAPGYSHQAKRAKDIAAAAVLITAIGAVIIGLLLLGPPLYAKLVGGY